MKWLDTILAKLLVLSVALILTGCDTWYDEPELVYLIKQGAHESNVEGSLPRNGLRSLKSEVLQFTTRFDQSAVYNIGEKDQGDVNKLFGFSDCNSAHHKNSARFGWNFNQERNEVDVFAYVYKEGNRLIERIGATKINETLTYRLSIQGAQFVFEFRDTTFRFERGSDCDMGLYYLLFPYFGGNLKAPHDIRIYIKELGG